MDDSLTLSNKSSNISNDENDKMYKKIKSEDIISKNEKIIEENIITKSYDKAANKNGARNNTNLSKLIKSISKSIKGNNNKEISLRNSLKDEDFDYLKSIIVKKKSKIDYEKVFGDIYELRENYEEDAKPSCGFAPKKKIIRLKLVRKLVEKNNVFNTNDKVNENNNNNNNNNVNNQIEENINSTKNDNINNNNVIENNNSNKKNNIKIDEIKNI